MSSAALFTPKEYQKLAVRFLIDNPRAMLVADPGMGKTSMTLSFLDLLMLVGSTFFPVLVIAPKRVADVVWTGEVSKWANFQHLRIVRIAGSAPEREALLKPLTADIYVINYDLIPWLTSIFPYESWPFKIVVADESSRLKGYRMNKGTQRAAALGKIARYTGRWVNLTGTPCPNGLQDLWGQMWFVDFGERLGRSYTAYLDSYFSVNRYSRKVSCAPEMQTLIHSKVADRVLALRAADWLDIQTPQEIPMPISLPPTALSRYREMERQLFMELDSGTEIEAATAAVKSQKLLQMASGSVYDQDGTQHAIHDAKLDGLDDILDQIAPQPLLVSYWWQFDVPRILAWCAARKIPAAVYRGEKEMRDWNKGKLRVMLLHAQSAFGLSLHERCHDVCFYSYYWSAELWQQMIERVGPARQAQAGFKRVVRVWTIQAQDTIEGLVIDSNRGKVSVEQAFKQARARRRS
jgi:hypothetical protein